MLEAFGLTDQGCVRTNNEDCFLIAPDQGLYIVADGMGGAQAGEEASRLATDAVQKYIGQNPARDQGLLLDAIHEANRVVLQESSRKAELEGMGTTIVAVLEAQEQADQSSGHSFCIASVGDSRAYVQDGEQLTAITDDQTWINEVGRRLGLDSDALSAHPMRHVLTMAIGVGDSLRINQYSVKLKPRMQLLLSSDGLHGVVEEKRISEILQDSRLNLKQRCQELVAAARKAGGPDNITVILLRLEQSS